MAYYYITPDKCLTELALQ